MIVEFRHLRIENFRRLAEPLEIGPLDGGLNVLAGDNEAGKSTVLEALRVALFDRHGLTGKAAADLQPYGHKVGPEVTLAFASSAGEYRLWKRFCQRAGARLEGPEGVYEGDAAEDALQRLLGFERPGRGATDQRHQGVWGLLWVTQGTTFQRPDPTESARRSLGAVLEGEVGDVLGGADGQRLLARLRDERARLWTATGRPGKALREAGERAAALEQALDGVLAELESFDQAVNELERRQCELAELTDPAAEQALRERLEAAETAHQRVETQRAERERLVGEHRVAEAEQERVEDEWTARQARIREFAEVDESLAALDATAAEAERSATDTESGAETARGTLETANAAVAEARRAERAAVAARERHEREKALAAEREALARADAEMKGAREVRQAVAGIRVTREAIDELRALEERLARAEVQLEAGATRVAAQVNVPASITGAAGAAGDGVWQVTGEAVLQLDGVGTVSITPGGADLEAAHARRAQARAVWRERVQGLEVTDAAAAEALLQRRDNALAEALAHERVAAAHVPDGLDAHRERIREGERRLAAMSEVTEAEAGDPDALRQRREECERAAADAQRRLDACNREAAARREQRVEARTRRDQQAQRRDRLALALAEARASEDDDALYARLAERRRALEGARTAVERADAALAAEDPETVALRLKTARAAVERTREERERLQRTVAELRVRLETLGHQGLGERRVELEAKLAEAQREQARLEREAGAVRLVADALETAASEARRTFLGPVTERLAPYLRLLMPDAELVLDDDLALTGVRRNGREEAFADLSLGTREQFAILVRLAFADLMAERGEAVPLILDDALAFADEQRFEAMKLALARAAERHQVLLLTCRPRDYRSLGAPLHRL